MNIITLAYVFSFSGLLFTTALILFSWNCDKEKINMKMLKYLFLVLLTTATFSVVSCNMAKLSYDGFSAEEELHYTDRVVERRNLLPVDDQGNYVKFELQNGNTIYTIKPDENGWDPWNHKATEPIETRMAINDATVFYFDADANYIEYRYMYKKWLFFRKYYIYKVVFIK